MNQQEQVQAGGLHAQAEVLATGEITSLHRCGGHYRPWDCPNSPNSEGKKKKKGGGGGVCMCSCCLWEGGEKYVHLYMAVPEGRGCLYFCVKNLRVLEAWCEGFCLFIKFPE